MRRIHSFIKGAGLKIAKGVSPIQLERGDNLSSLNSSKDQVNSYTIGSPEPKPAYRAYTLHQNHHPHLQKFFEPCTIPTLSGARIKNAHLLTIYGDYIVDDNRNAICSTIARVDDHDAIQLSNLLPSWPRKTNGTAILLIQREMWWQNYFHWTVDYLSKIVWAQRLLGQSQEISALYIAKKDTLQYQQESLKSMGIKEKNIHLCPTVGRLMHVRARDLLVIQERYEIETLDKSIHNNTIHPSIVNEIANTVINHLGLEVPKPIQRKSNRLLISRKNAPNRRLTNEEQTSEYLSELGFRMVQLEDLSFREQVELFSTASIVIGTHGAGLTNLVYSSECCVLELFTSNHRHGSEYLQITNIRRGFYSYHILESMNAFNDIYAPRELLAKYIETLIANEKCNRQSEV